MVSKKNRPGFFLFYRLRYDRKGCTVLNIENKRICLFISSISGYQVILPDM